MKRIYSLQKRHLQFFPHPRPELVLANNSGLFFSLASLKMHDHDAHRELTIIEPEEFWLSKIHPDHRARHWGQTPRGLPWYVQQEFFDIFPQHRKNELLSWGQFDELREYVIFQLRKKGINIHKGMPIITKLATKYQIELPNNAFNMPLNTFFYNTFRTPNRIHGLAGAPDAPPHAHIYSLPFHKMPKTVVLIGGGRSVIWMAQHFPDSMFACIKHKSIAFPLLSNEIKPINLIDYPLESFGLDDSSPFRINHLVDQMNEPGTNAPFIEIIDTQNQGRDFSGPIYCAIGLKPNYEITACVDKQNLLKFSYETLNWVSSAEMPVGSLIETALFWAEKTNNLAWAYETHCYHEEHFVDVFTQQMKKAGIRLPDHFFDLLKDHLLAFGKMELTFNQSSKQIPTEEQVIQIYKDCYSQAFEHKITKEMLDKLERAVRCHEKKRLHHYQNETNSLMAVAF